MSRSTFSAGATFDGTTFTHNVHLDECQFGGLTSFDGVAFKRTVGFAGSEFTDDAIFSDAIFEGMARFDQTTFMKRVVFLGTTFANTLFINTQFAGSATFPWATIGGYMDLRGTRVDGLLEFWRSLIPQDASLRLGASVREGGRLVLEELGTEPGTDHAGAILERATGRDYEARGAPHIELSMDLERVELRGFSPERVRLRDCQNMERMALFDVAWPPRDGRFIVADEEDLRNEMLRGREQPTLSELERVYRGMRRNREGAGDVVGAHGWYVSEMEMGRRTRELNVRWLARTFYHLTSNYGLSLARPLIILGVTFLLLSAVLTLDGPGSCTVTTRHECASGREVVHVVISTMTFQSLPEGIQLEGIRGTVFNGVARVLAGAMFVAIGVALRNQVARS